MVNKELTLGVDCRGASFRELRAFAETGVLATVLICLAFCFSAAETIVSASVHAANWPSSRRDYTFETAPLREETGTGAVSSERRLLDRAGMEPAPKVCSGSNPRTSGKPQR